MQEAEVIIASLHSKIEKLILLHKAAAAEVSRLAAENESLRAEIAHLKRHVSELENKLNNTQLTEIMKGSGFEKDELRMRLDAMIGEIDKCLAILNQ